jgi:hypothetical protein
MKIKTFETLAGAAFMKMDFQEIAALSRDEQVRLAFRIRAIMVAIATYIKAVKKKKNDDGTIKENDGTTAAIFDIQSEADLLNMKPQYIAALSKDELEQLALRSQDVLKQCPIKAGCRFCGMPDEYILHVLLEWLTIEDHARTRRGAQRERERGKIRV